ncbi:hypothetical protein CHLRE_01g033550v5 [Chlamydomonas reinhardtii]|uniref:protein disulfide-isomerase n=1 Tax=Chlamydomonas reinhardtii TaxID=3055 RepID=A8HQT1_CHLRE|nr:uncharacterized protein CHLRE_01g033550v5 [Chlamydomonas reinhardtii]PNW88536.1 hypothetical protein CHLRE_01g033550v5 [Chlamydomonas reinhardtii]|eukprot:XP_001689618.1 protein disulfide isomerase [Chlamydomonas reinhardtii]
MRSLLVVALVGALALTAHAAGGGGDDPTIKLENVHDLTPDNFDKIVNGAKHVLIEFYAPWCGHCKRMVPEYKKLGELVAADPKLKNRVVVAKVNADAHRSLGDKFDVRGFPTIKFFPAGKPATKDNMQDYNQARTASAFLDFLKEKLAADKGFARVEALDALAKKFVDAAADAKAKVVEEAEAALAKLEGEAKDNGALYVTFMKKAVEKGSEYLTKEKARLEKLLAGGSVNAAKVDEMSRKTSVLGAFAAEDEE